MTIWVFLGLCLATFGPMGIRDSKMKLLIYFIFMFLLCGLYTCYSWNDIWWACLICLPLASISLSMLSNFIVDLFCVLKNRRKYNSFKNMFDTSWQRKDLVDQLHRSHYTQRPAFALLLAQFYVSEDREKSIMYACLAIQMVDSVEPSDLIGPYRWITEDLCYCDTVYRRVAVGYYDSSEEYQEILNAYRSEQPSCLNSMSRAADAERKKSF